ncbi:DUF4357 domain-containing protein [Acidaminococcus sp.]|uniref:DUF4357 domain-containing protein n=1 Tax=Acidaminococcus sp. TaxID=1872103 RepID=UPI003D7DEFE1
MANRYIIKYNNGAIEMTKPNSTILVYKIPYVSLESKKTGFVIPNPFVVYILVGKDDNHRDVIYVGKSKNSLENRPTSHKDKCAHWLTCYVLTQFKERTFFNDGTIQYLENELNHRIDEVKMYINTTKTTNSGTASSDDKDDSDDYLNEVYKMLYMIGLDLITHSEEQEAAEDIAASTSMTSDYTTIPDGIYYFARRIRRMGNTILKGRMEVEKGTFILLPGSDVALEAGIGLAPSVDDIRNATKIENGKLMERVILNSPSACSEFIIGSSCNGWLNWKTENGETINKFRKQVGT